MSVLSGIPEVQIALLELQDCKRPLDAECISPWAHYQCRRLSPVFLWSIPGLHVAPRELKITQRPLHNPGGSSSAHPFPRVLDK